MAQAHLAELDLSDNALGPIGMEGLVQFLKSPVCYSLKTLRLNNNGLGIYGGRVISIIIEVKTFFARLCTLRCWRKHFWIVLRTAKKQVLH